MSLADDITTLKTTLTSSSSAIKAAFARKVQAAFVADNSLLLGGLTREQLVALAQQAVDAHSTSTGNPHGTTAADLSMYTTVQIQNLIAGVVPTGIIPLTQLGDPLFSAALGATVTAGTRTVAFPANIPLFMAGGSYNMPAASFVVPDNTTQYFYARLVAGVPTWIMTSVYAPETTTNTLCGVVTFASGAVTKNTLNKVTRIDIYRISSTSAGSAIPVSGGDPSATSTLVWK